MDTSRERIQKRLELLPRLLRDHVERVRCLAYKLAVVHRLDRESVDLAAMGHDLARAMTGNELRAEARRLEIPVLPVEELIPVLLHGPIAARWLEDAADALDHGVIEAIRWHTTGRQGMDQIAKVIYLADKLEPEKVGRDPGLERPQSFALNSIDKALLALLDHQIISTIKKGYLIHPYALETRNWLLSEIHGPCLRNNRNYP